MKLLKRKKFKCKVTYELLFPTESKRLRKEKTIILHALEGTRTYLHQSMYFLNSRKTQKMKIYTALEFQSQNNKLQTFLGK